MTSMGTKIQFFKYLGYKNNSIKIRGENMIYSPSNGLISSLNPENPASKMFEIVQQIHCKSCMKCWHLYGKNLKQN